MKVLLAGLGAILALAACRSGDGFGDAGFRVARFDVYGAARHCESLAGPGATFGSGDAGIALLCVDRLLGRQDLRPFERAIVENLHAGLLLEAGEPERAGAILDRLMKTRDLPSGFYARVQARQAQIKGVAIAPVPTDEVMPAPIEAVKPGYPAAAAAAGLVGCVLVEFTIEEDGHTSNHAVVTAEPPGMFEQSALDAASRFRYRPATWQGVPVKQFGIRYLFVFEPDGSDGGKAAAHACI